MIAPLAEAANLGIALVGLGSAFGVGLVFIQAGVAKLRHRNLFPGVVAQYRLLPARLVAPAAQVLPPLEVALGLALLAGGWRLAVVPAALLLSLFALAMAVNLGRRRRLIDCGCGHAHLRQPLSWTLVVRNLALASLLLFRLLPAPAPALAQLATAALLGVTMFVLNLLLNGLTALAASPLMLRGGR